MSMPEVVELLRSVTDAELRARRAQHVEPDDAKYIKLVRAWDALLGQGLWAGISRPSRRPAKHYQTSEQRKAAALLQARTLYAIARYEHGKGTLYRAWLGSTRLGPRGEAMSQNLYVTEHGHEREIVADSIPCRTCGGTGTFASPTCSPRRPTPRRTCMSCGCASWRCGAGSSGLISTTGRRRPPHRGPAAELDCPA